MNIYTRVPYRHYVNMLAYFPLCILPHGCRMCLVLFSVRLCARARATLSLPCIHTMVRRPCEMVETAGEIDTRAHSRPHDKLQIAKYWTLSANTHVRTLLAGENRRLRAAKRRIAIGSRFDGDQWAILVFVYRPQPYIGSATKSFVSMEATIHLSRHHVIQHRLTKKNIFFCILWWVIV